MGIINEITDSSYFVLLFAGVMKALALGIIFALVLISFNSVDPYIILPVVNIEFPLIDIITYIIINNIFTPFLISIFFFDLFKNSPISILISD